MRNFIYFLILLFIVSCNSNTIYEKPENLIPKDSMIFLLTDMYIASSAKHIKNKFLQKDVNYTALVYNKYKIDSARFDISNNYYTSRVEEYNELINKVKTRLEAEHKMYQEKIDKLDSIKRDSLKKKTIKPKLLDSARKIKLKKAKLKDRTQPE
ncbi:uncharacterized protein DUF4296 [Tenacibaculum adriaticum]|uniref:Uncharacterized protein DUF4296 n=1 Tax=Tenacibaculum adriaticum TaxID=413713 RepID=A0A5S5DW67_9FLAO|nr:DUF4296 domain-containing protein [Tenacibaculum adriaticum]TYP99974.1 uncharacterized protein DUF4296 [Tenacibaculum adriaticum]